MICVSIGEKTIKATIAALEKVEFAEIRLDLIEDLDFDGLKKMLDIQRALIITFRPGKVDENLRIRYLTRSIELGVKYLDIEIESEAEIIKNLIDRGKTFNTKIIISYHNYNETPKLDILIDIVKKGKALGGDLIKIATLINNSGDNLSLMELLEEERGVVVIGMGKKGKISRIMSVFMGSPFTFASLSEGKETAEGQLDLEKMKRILLDLK